MSKELALLDSIEEIRQKAAEKPNNYPVDYAIRLVTAMVAEYVGFQNRRDWTEELKQDNKSKYASRLANNTFHV